MIEALPPDSDDQTAYVERICPEHLIDGLLNVVIYGPGKGEAIVTVLPDGSVGVVDGCIEPNVEEGRPDPVRELLDALAPPRLEFVVLTHPHDDHYAGLGRILEGWQRRTGLIASVDFAQPRSWTVLVEQIIRDKAGLSRPKADEIKGLELFLKAWGEERRAGTKVIRLQDETIVMRADDIRLVSCGPSTPDAEEATRILVEYSAEQRETESLDPNRLSGALTLRWKDAGVLLTGDLLNHHLDNRGWRSAASYVQAPIQVINVAHHGSKKADYDPLWEKIAGTLELAIVTPFQFAKNKQPPRPEDIERILQRGVRTVITTPPEWILKPGPRHGMKGARARRTSHAERNNAVAVALEPDGSIQRITLAGAARFYGLMPSK